jgi:hypothetical protein
MKTTIALGGLLAFACAGPVLAGETVTEHETYEKKSMKVETIPPPAKTERTVEETETSRVQRERPPVVEERRTIVPGPTVKEKTVETETHDDDDD